MLYFRFPFPTPERFANDPPSSYKIAQCVWPSTQKVGMASAVSKSGKRYVVARYRPSGNMIGQSAC